MFKSVQDYFLETLNEEDFFGRKVTFTALSEIHVEGSGKVFSTTHTAFSRPYPPTPSRLFLQTTGAKRKPSGTRLKFVLIFSLMNRTIILTL